MSKSFQSNLVSQEGTFYDGKRMDVSVRKVEGGPLMVIWKGSSMTKLKVRN
jgi:hypothetical protein